MACMPSHHITPRKGKLVATGSLQVALMARVFVYCTKLDDVFQFVDDMYQFGYNIDG